MPTSTDRSSFRYERKYLTTSLSAYQLENFVLNSPLLFRPIYQPRQVNSIYFDTPRLDYFQQNSLGVTPRLKVRARWYGVLNEPSNLQIEIKHRAGEVIQKKVFPKTQINPFELEEMSRITKQQLEANLPEAHALRAVLANSYQRRYYYSSSSQLRITIDDSVLFSNITDWRRRQTTYTLAATILEVKYSLQQDNQLRQLISSFPVHISKSSKYVMGIKQCYTQKMFQ